MPYKLVIFDFDGTLADSFPYFLSNINTLAAAYNFQPVNPQDVEQLRGMDARQLMKNARLPAWKIPFIARSFIRRMARDIDQIHLFAGVADGLKQLAGQGIRLAIVSSNSEANVRRVLGPDIAPLIAYYGCGAALFGKQRKFRRAMTRCGLTPGGVLCVGDEVRDMEAAEAVGMTFGGVAWGYTRADVLTARADVVLFYTVDEMIRFARGV